MPTYDPLAGSEVKHPIVFASPEAKALLDSERKLEEDRRAFAIMKNVLHIANDIIEIIINTYESNLCEGNRGMVVESRWRKDMTTKILDLLFVAQGEWIEEERRRTSTR